MQPSLMLISYVNDKAGNRKAILYAETPSLDTPTFSLGFAICHPDDQFNKLKGRYVAANRARVWAERRTETEIPENLRTEFEKFLARCTKYFKGKSPTAQYDSISGTLLYGR